MLLVKILTLMISFNNLNGDKASESHRSRHRRSIPSPSDAKLVLDKHNEFRATIGSEGEEPIPSNMRVMTWDDGLAVTSLRYAKNCVWGHSKLGERKTKIWNKENGENLWAATGDLADNFDPVRPVQVWFDEYVDYDFHNHTCTPKKKCGHYTQIVWANSYKLGCAWNLCPILRAEGQVMEGAMYMVCQYAPGGNVLGENLYKIGERCADCGSKDTCPDDALCHNEKRDIIFPLDNNADIIASALVGVVLVLVGAGIVGYYWYTHYADKSSILIAWRKRRRVSSVVDIDYNKNGLRNSRAVTEKNGNAQSDAVDNSAPPPTDEKGKDSLSTE
uniref:glioma pathogenesis-related protein 1-like n=1 Tax=Ciona intestinalis TaxID=7719 RepID=UPI00089DD303|nr:glioma pathogenesis-related protein 1-like [Ciona intestinalis]|eukprot:XP_018667311.1 glioma pathogenesis-related protein 1-like [Ciona intestinalis]